MGRIQLGDDLKAHLRAQETGRPIGSPLAAKIHEAARMQPEYHDGPMRVSDEKCFGKTPRKKWRLFTSTSEHARDVTVLEVTGNFVMIRNDDRSIEYVGWPTIESLRQVIA